MLGKNPPQANPTKDKIAQHLRAADILVKEGKHDDAVFQLENALQLDPKNYFARSFLERLRVQIAGRQKKETERGERNSASDDQKIEQIAMLLRAADQFIAAKNYKLALQQVANVYALDPQNYYAQGYSDRIDQLMEEEKTKSAPAPAAKPAGAPAPPAPRATPTARWKDGERASVAMYRELLKEMWFDGKITEAEAKELQKIRSMFTITDEEHTQIEKEVHIDAYVEALRIAWRDGVVSQNENEVLKLMREKYTISVEDHISAEARILWAKNTPQGKRSIMLVDDEPTLLLSLAARLKKHGYDILSAQSAEEGLELLQQAVPSIIVSDLLLGEGKLTGLEFYQKIRENPRLNNVPFLLMSGISDDFVVRAGIRMGVDNFIQKPFDLELLLATIEGKLKN